MVPLHVIPMQTSNFPLDAPNTLQCQLDDEPAADFGLAIHTPEKIKTPPPNCSRLKASFKNIQPNTAAATASMKITSEENTAEREPSATANNPCPPV